MRSTGLLLLAIFIASLCLSVHAARKDSAVGNGGKAAGRSDECGRSKPASPRETSVLDKYFASFVEYGTLASNSELPQQL